MAGRSVAVGLKIDKGHKSSEAAREWEELADHWLLRLEADRSPATLALYRVAVKGTFLKWLATTGWGGSLDGLTSEHLNMFVLQLKKEKSPSTVTTYRAALANFWKWMKSQGEVTEDLFKTRDIARVKIQEPVVPYLTPEQLEALRKAARREKDLAPRDVALVSLLVGTGLRVSELAALDVDDVVMGSRKVIVRHGKGDKAREAAFGLTTADDLSTYMRWRRKYLEGHTRRGRGGGSQPALFVGRVGDRLTSGGIEARIGLLGKAAGIDGLHPHQLRHTHFSLAALEGKGDWELRRQGGWSRTSAMPLRYTALVQQERALEEMRDFDPMRRRR
ncbi:MAG: tyrosine-type recombinase/integrase [Thermomicrobiales bacterium]